MKQKTLWLLSMAIVTTVALVFGVISFALEKNATSSSVGRMNTSEGHKISFLTTFSGSFEKPLIKPMDILVTKKKIYVTDATSRNVQVFDKNGKWLFSIGDDGKNGSKFVFPYGITCDSSGRVYVADMKAAKILIFDEDGKYLFEFKGKDTKEITYPGGIRIAKDLLYVTNIADSKVYVFKLDGTKKLTIDQFGKDGDSLSAPNSLAVKRNGDIIVSDSGKKRLLIFDKNGQFKQVVNGSKENEDKSVFENPRGVSITTDGNIFAIDIMSHLVFGFNKNGEKIIEIGGLGETSGKMGYPNGLYIDEENKLYITDMQNQRINIFQYQ